MCIRDRCWTSLGHPKIFFNALLPFGHTYCWFAPVVAVLEHHAQSNVFHFVKVGRARLGYHAESARLQ